MAGGKRALVRRLRAPLRSPGRPGVAKREDRRRFWLAIAAGCSSEDAAVDAGNIPSGGAAVVPGGRRHATNTSGAWRATAVGAVSVLRRARGDRAPEGAGSRRARDRPADRSCALDDLAGAAAQRSHAQRGPGVPGHDGAMACRAGGPRPKAAKLATNEALRRYVEDRLAGRIAHPDGRPISRPRDDMEEAPSRPAARCGDGRRPGARSRSRRG